MATRNIYSDTQSAINCLKNNNVLAEVDKDAGIVILRHDVNIGIKLWGAVDYLVNHGGYAGWAREVKR